MDQSPSKFLFAISPVVFWHVLIPPLSFFYGERLHPSSPLSSIFNLFYRYVTPPSLLYVDNVLELTLDPAKDSDIEHLAPWFTHVFVHGTYEHMLLNLQGLLVNSYPVFGALGAGPMWTLFLLGGAVSELPTALHAFRAQGTLPGTALLPSFLRRGLRSLLSFFQLHREVHCGSSGGIFALVGGCGALLGLRMGRLLLACHRAGVDALCSQESRSQRVGSNEYGNGNGNGSGNSSRNNYRSRRLPHTSTSATPGLLVYLRHAARRLCTAETFLVSTQIMSQFFTISREVNYLTREASSSVNYAAHVQGYIFGIISTTILLLVQQQKRSI